jgi:hypothetical protein
LAPKSRFLTSKLVLLITRLTPLPDYYKRHVMYSRSIKKKGHFIHPILEGELKGGKVGTPGRARQWRQH